MLDLDAIKRANAERKTVIAGMSAPSHYVDSVGKCLDALVAEVERLRSQKNLTTCSHCKYTFIWESDQRCPVCYYREMAAEYGKRMKEAEARWEREEELTIKNAILLNKETALKHVIADLLQSLVGKEHV